jgi:hypothetical protein
MAPDVRPLVMNFEKKKNTNVTGRTATPILQYQEAWTRPPYVPLKIFGISCTVHKFISSIKNVTGIKKLFQHHGDLIHSPHLHSIAFLYFEVMAYSCDSLFLPY